MVEALIFVITTVTIVNLLINRVFKRNAAINTAVETAKSLTTKDDIKTLEATFQDLKKYAYNDEEYEIAVKMLYDVANKSIKRAELQKQKDIYFSNLMRKY